LVRVTVSVLPDRLNWAEADRLPLEPVYNKSAWLVPVQVNNINAAVSVVVEGLLVFLMA